MPPVGVAARLERLLADLTHVLRINERLRVSKHTVLLPPAACLLSLQQLAFKLNGFDVCLGGHLGAEAAVHGVPWEVVLRPWRSSLLKFLQSAWIPTQNVTVPWGRPACMH